MNPAEHASFEKSPVNELRREFERLAERRTALFAAMHRCESADELDKAVFAAIVISNEANAAHREWLAALDEG